MKVIHRLAAASLLLGAACATAPAPAVMELPFGDPARSRRQAPLVLDAVTETATGSLLTPDELAKRLAGVKLVFVGESHTQVESHRVEARLIEALVAAGRPVLVGLEMLPRAEQEALDRWNDGTAAEGDFLRAVHWYKHWGYNFGLYRDIFLYARAHGVRLYAVNAPREVITSVRRKGLDRLTDAERAHLPPRIDTANDEQRRLFRAQMGGGDHGAPHPGLSATDEEGMFRAQCTWDAVMAYNAIQALSKYGGDDAIMVVLIGAGHLAFGLGAPRQAALWSTGPVAAVIPVPVVDDGRAAKPSASYGDFLWGVPEEEDRPAFPALGVSLVDRKGTDNPVVVDVVKGSPAEKAGLRTDDRIASVDGQPVPDKEAFLLALSTRRWGDAVRVGVERGADRLTLAAVLRRDSR